MKLLRFTYIGFNFLILSVSVFLFLGIGHVEIYQTLTLELDGEGSTSIHLITSDSNLVNTKIIGNFPFTEDEAKAYFTSPNTEVKTVGPYQRPEVQASYMVLTIDFKDINKISEAKGFSDINASWTKTDSGMFFKWTILKNSLQSNLIGGFLYVFSFSGEVINSNGTAYEDTVKWVINPETYDYTNDIVLTALINTDEKSSCGIFGMEFPLILLGGFVFSYSYRKGTKFSYGYRKGTKKEFPFLSPYNNNS